MLQDDGDYKVPSNVSKKMRESLALNRPASSSSSEDSDEGQLFMKDDDVFRPADVATATDPSVDNKLYCVCQCPHDDVSEMIGCDAPDCRLEWFHFECVGIMVPPEGKWYCPECTKRYQIKEF